MSLSNILRNASNLIGWSTPKKIIVIESDDWGAIRMSSKEALVELAKRGVVPSSTDEARYLSNDGLASEDDLACLFEVLTLHKDSIDNHCKFTAVGLTANPDFKKIKADNFRNYHYELLPETLSRYPCHSKSFKLWEEGIRNHIFVPQFHGREHLNVSNWMKALQEGEEDTRIAFEHEVYGITPRKPINHVSYQAAFDVFDPSDIASQKLVIQDGLAQFEALFGYKASFFVPTNGPFNNSLEKDLASNGIKYIGASKLQHEPIGFGKTRWVFHYIGQKNKYNQRYLTRNCFFEPSSDLQSDWVDSCLAEISIAFKWNKPAVISSHRVNYIGWLNPDNRNHGLKELSRLLKSIKQQWPDVTFMTSEEMGKLVEGKQK
jgi:hypothetical protein